MLIPASAGGDACRKRTGPSLYETLMRDLAKSGSARRPARSRRGRATGRCLPEAHRTQPPRTPDARSCEVWEREKASAFPPRSCDGGGACRKRTGPSLHEPLMRDLAKSRNARRPARSCRGRATGRCLPEAHRTQPPRTPDARSCEVSAREKPSAFPPRSREGTVHGIAHQVKPDGRLRGAVGGNGVPEKTRMAPCRASIRLPFPTSTGKRGASRHG
jgi:hypothetical protein